MRALLAAVVAVTAVAVGCGQRAQRIPASTVPGATAQATQLQPAPGVTVTTSPGGGREAARLAIEFLTSAQRGEDVSNLVVDERPTGPDGPRVAAPDLPAQVAADARALAGLDASFESAPVLTIRQRDGSLRELAYPPATWGPGCTIPADIYIVCSVIVRAASGEGIVNVAFLSRRGQPDLLVAGFTIEVPWPSFTG